MKVVKILYDNVVTYKQVSYL